MIHAYAFRGEVRRRIFGVRTTLWIQFADPGHDRDRVVRLHARYDRTARER
jgi:hypothetical protein